VDFVRYDPSSACGISARTGLAREKPAVINPRRIQVENLPADIGICREEERVKRARIVIGSFAVVVVARLNQRLNGDG